MADEPGFRVTRRTPVADAGFLRIEAIDVTTPDGGEVRRYAVRHPGAVAVIPVDGDDIILIRQYRAPVETNLLEVPAGKLDVAGEPPAETAARELEEEIGMRAGHIEPVFGFWTGPGFTDEYMYLFVARDMEPVPTAPHGPEEEASELVRVPRADLGRLLASGEIQDVKTLVALQWLALQG